MERDEWMSDQVAGEIEDLRRRFGFEKKRPSPTGIFDMSVS
jgi:hypothetical protein